jgi:NADH-quinone oxidoreductase subunit G
MSSATAAAAGVGGESVVVKTAAGSVELPVQIVGEMADNVVWLPTNSPRSKVRSALHADHGSSVRIAPAGGES